MKSNISAALLPTLQSMPIILLYILLEAPMSAIAAILPVESTKYGWLLQVFSENGLSTKLRRDPKWIKVVKAIIISQKIYLNFAYSLKEIL